MTAACAQAWAIGKAPGAITINVSMAGGESATLTFPMDEAGHLHAALGALLGNGGANRGGGDGLGHAGLVRTADAAPQHDQKVNFCSTPAGGNAARWAPEGEGR